MAEVMGYARIEGQTIVGVSTPLVPRTSSYSKTPYRVILVNRYGTALAEFEKATISNIHWELNGDHTATFSVPSSDTKLGLMSLSTTEVQIKRGNKLLWWGIPLRVQSNSKTTEVQAIGLSWYFRKRVFGPIPKPNYMTNGGFESGLAGWLTFGTFTRSLSKSTVFNGLRSLKMVSTQPKGAETFSFRYYSYTLPVYSDRADTVTAVAWLYIEDFKEAAKYSRGLYVSVTNHSTGELYQAAATVLNSTTPRRKWIRYEVSVKVQPRSVAQRVTVRLYAPQGTVYWDDVSLSIDKRLGYKNHDQALIAKGLVEHAQSVTYGKGSLNIATACPLTGVKRNREYLFSNRQTIREALDEFPTLAKGIEWDIVITDTTRTFRTYYPRKGAIKTKLVLELGRNIVDYSTSVDADQTANVIAVMAAGEGADREEGYSKYAADPVLEKVYNATPGSAPQSLNAQAQRGVTRYKVPVNIPSVTTHEGAGQLIGLLGTGDIVPVRIQHGWVNTNGNYRILAIDLNPQNDQLTYTLNPAETSF